MDLINLSNIEDKFADLQNQWNDPSKPFKFLVFENFFHPEKAFEILNAYPKIEESEWNGTTYINQKNKFTKTTFDESEQILADVFAELNSNSFLKVLEDLTGIESLISDNDLFGGGLHQSTTGAFLDVHVDFNFHPQTKTHRRMNLIVYLNENWDSAYNGNLELWDMQSKVQLADIAPTFNRCVIFETNEVSFHGHPKKLKTPAGVSRKSIAVYYYTKNREHVADSHNTVYVNTEGMSGTVKNFWSGIKALKERLFRKK